MPKDDLKEAAAASGERRNHRRVPLKQPATLYVGGAATRCECLSLSIGGAAVKGSGAMPGAEVRVVIPVGSSKIDVQAEVVRIDGGVLGLRFLKLDKSSLKALLSVTSSTW
jgi:PilZ domain